MFNYGVVTEIDDSGRVKIKRIDRPLYEKKYMVSNWLRVLIPFGPAGYSPQIKLNDTVMTITESDGSGEIVLGKYSTGDLKSGSPGLEFDNGSFRFNKENGCITISSTDVKSISIRSTKMRSDVIEIKADTSLNIIAPDVNIECDNAVVKSTNVDVESENFHVESDDILLTGGSIRVKDKGGQGTISFTPLGRTLPTDSGTVYWT